MSVIEQLKSVADQHADRTAVQYLHDGRWCELNYRQLLESARAIASAMLSAGVESGDAVVLAARRDAELIPRLVATLWTGAHYVFIDPKYPVERQQLIASDCQARWGFGLDALDLPELTALDTGTFANDPVDDVDAILDGPVDKEQSAYVMFTSGSTGTPKGVVVPHRAITRLVNHTDYIAFSHEQRFLLHSSLSFDASTLEIWGALLNGGTCVLLPQQQSLTVAALDEIVREQRITTLWLTSSLFNYVVSQSIETLAPLQQLLIGGEALSPSHVKQVREQLPKLQIFNGYGPTENTTFTTVYPINRLPVEQLTALPNGIPIGLPINGTECEVFDDNLQPVEAGQSGELLAFGDGLASGYLNRAELTAEKFIDVKRANGNTQRGYRTGDIVLKRDDGAYEYRGRRDRQVKIDGHRIELGEIENQLMAIAGVTAAAVLAVSGPQQQIRIAAYIVSDSFAADTYRQYLSAALPAFMLPHFFISVDQLPLNQNGKLDAARLPDPFETQASNTTAAGHESTTAELAMLVGQCWQAILGRPVDPQLNFLDAGGTSLEAVRLAESLAQKFDQPLSETFVFENASINAQASYFAGRRRDSSSPSARPALDKPDFAVIGMSCRLPGADDIDSYWENLLSGKESVSFFSADELSEEVSATARSSEHYVAAKGVVDDADKFDAKFFGISPLEASLMDPQQRIMLQLAWHALEQAGYAPGEEGLDIGVFAGANWNRYYQQYVLSNQQLLDRFGAFNAGLSNEADFLSTRISYKLNLRGPSVNVFTACSTGLVAIAQACAAIEQGQCDVALAGGASISTPLNAGYLYQEGGMLSRDGHCRPFDAQASGTTFNDGAGFVVLKRLDLAERDGDTIHAVVKGYAVNNDGANKASYTAPSVSGQVDVYRQALARAAIAPDTVGYIETHGTATPLGDPIEVESLRQAYASDKTFRCAIGSVKSNIGHVIHAAGVASFIKSTLAVREGKIPATLHFEQPNPKLNLQQTPFYVNADLETWHCTGPRRAAVSSLGVGGTNAHIIVEQYQTNDDAQQTQPPVDDDAIYPLLLSAKSATALQQQIAQHQQFFAAEPKASLRNAAYTAASLKPQFAFRAAFHANSHAALADQLAQSKKKLSAADCSSQTTGFLFTGQGSQRAQMGRWLYDNDTQYRQMFDGASALLETEFGYNLEKIVLGDAAYRQNAQWDINQTAIAQPALFLLELGVAQWLQRKGLSPAFLIGHSIGEYAAAVIAGVMDFASAIRIVAKRGSLMQQQPPGDMLAVKASFDQFEDLLPAQLDLAASNAPALNVVSGPAEHVQQLQAALDSRDIGYTLLKTSHAFHSSMMEPMLDDFGQYLTQFEFSAPSLPIYSTATGKLLTDEAMAADYWVQQIRSPVLYAQSLREAVEASAGQQIALLEVGPGTTLSSLARLQQYDKTVAVLSSLPSSAIDESGGADLYGCLGHLWERGFTVNWAAQFEHCQRSDKVDLPLYPFDPERHWLELPQQTAASAGTIGSGELANQIQQIQTQLLAVSGAAPAISTPQNQGTPMSSSQHKANVQQKLIAVFEDVTGYDLADLEAEAPFGEAGLDSLLLTQASIALDQQYGGGITFRNLVEDYTCLAELTDFYLDIIPVETTQSPASGAAPAGNTATAAPIDMSALSALTTGAAGNDITALVTAQLQIMQLQLQALGGAPISAAAAGAAPAAIIVDNSNDISADSSADKDSNDKPVAETSPARRHAPGAKIARESTAVKLSNAQREWLDTQMETFQSRFAASKAYAQNHRKQLADPRTVSGFNPEWKETVFPVVTKASKGSKLWDIDDNELIDITNGFGPILFGHSPDFITEAVKKQIDLGIETGPQSPLAGEVAQMFCEITGNERCSFASTGSEAVIGAIRLARTVTGRKTVVMFEGAYHGIFDEVIVRAGRDYQALPGAPGILREMTANMKVLPWGDPESIEVIRELGNNVAAVLVEPVQSRKPGFNDASYIQRLRSVTRDIDAALILDEVVTGFRVAPGGIRERFNIDADLVTYGKVIGGGYPIGIIGGSARFMDALDGGHWQFGDDSIPEVGVTFFAGTFVRHPLSLAAAKAVLSKIKQHGQSLYDELEQKTAKLAGSTQAFIEELNCDAGFEQFASLFYVSMPAAAHWGHVFYQLMMLEGIYLQQYRPSFLTTEHSEQDVEKILTAFKKSLATMVEHGLIEGDMLAAKKFLNEKPGIPEGARLGRNEKGEPAYFIEDPDNKGQFIEVGKP